MFFLILFCLVFSLFFLDSHSRFKVYFPEGRSLRTNQYLTENASVWNAPTFACEIAGLAEGCNFFLTKNFFKIDLSKKSQTDKKVKGGDEKSIEAWFRECLVSFQTRKGGGKK